MVLVPLFCGSRLVFGARLCGEVFTLECVYSEYSGWNVDLRLTLVGLIQSSGLRSSFVLDDREVIVSCCSVV